MKKILLVEDEDQIREMYSTILSNLYDLDIAVDGEIALNKVMAPENKYDLILLDVMLPKIDGVNILRKIKTTEGSPNKETPVFMLTNLGLDEVISETKEIGAVKTIIKSSILPQQLLTEIQSVLA